MPDVPHIGIGPYQIFAIQCGLFRLDGGAMFGVVPRVLWQKQCPPDDINRVQLCMRVLLAVDRAAGRVIMVDSGAGDKWSAEETERFAFEVQGDPLGRGLRALGIRDEDVSDVIVTHLHFDHNGGLTVQEARDEKPVPRFRNARHWVHARHLAHAASPTLKDRASFYSRDFEPVQYAGLFEVVEGDAPRSPLPHLSWLITHGHTPYQILPWFHDDHQALQFVADLVPTTAHLPVPWVMAYDNEPLRTLNEKQALLRRCAEEHLILFFEHDPEMPAARIDVSGKRPTVKEKLQL